MTKDDQATLIAGAAMVVLWLLAYAISVSVTTVLVIMVARWMGVHV